MKIFLLDLWNDLRAKRLWPVAVLLLAGLVAVPVVLLKSAEQPPSAAPAAQTRTAPEPKALKGLANVRLDGAEVGQGSSLDTFDPDDPFRPPAKVVKESQKSESSVFETTPDAGSSEASGGGGTSGSGGDSTSGGGTGDTGTGDTGGDDTGGGTTTTQYTYVIDVTFSANGRTRRIKGMERLDMLPNQAAPLLLFLGVSANAGNAVFLVDSTLDAAGEGKCKPSNADCAFLYLGAGSEHAFTNPEGDSYELKIDEIRKVKVDADDTKGATANAAVGASTPRRFVPPLIADLVSMSSATAGDSDSDKDRR